MKWFVSDAPSLSRQQIDGRQALQQWAIKLWIWSFDFICSAWTVCGCDRLQWRRQANEKGHRIEECKQRANKRRKDVARRENPLLPGELGYAVCGTICPIAAGRQPNNSFASDVLVLHKY
jgi:hypothetical protein